MGWKMAELEAVCKLEDCCHPEDTVGAGQWGERMHKQYQALP